MKKIVIKMLLLGVLLTTSLLSCNKAVKEPESLGATQIENCDDINVKMEWYRVIIEEEHIKRTTYSDTANGLSPAYEMTERAKQYELKLLSLFKEHREVIIVESPIQGSPDLQTTNWDFEQYGIEDNWIVNMIVSFHPDYVTIDNDMEWFEPVDSGICDL